MKKQKCTDVEECYCKIEALLKEYNCELEIDHELGGDCILVDKDTKRFEILCKIKPSEEG